MSVMKRMAAMGQRALARNVARSVINGDQFEAWAPRFRGGGLGGLAVRSQKKGAGKQPFSVVVTGNDELDAAMRALPKNLQRKLARQASRKAAKEVVLPDAQRRAPVQQDRKHGRGVSLRNALTVRAIRRSRRYIGHEVLIRPGAFSGRPFYPAFVEFGTKTRETTTYRGEESRRSTGRIPKRTFHFLRPALYENTAKIKEVFIEALRDFVKEANREAAYREKMGNEFVDEFRVNFGGAGVDRVMRTAKSISEARKMEAWTERMGEDWRLF